MENRISLRRGPSEPTSNQLVDYEVGFDTNGKRLYIKDGLTQNVIPAAPIYYAESKTSAVDNMALNAPLGAILITNETDQA